MSKPLVKGATAARALERLHWMDTHLTSTSAAQHLEAVLGELRSAVAAHVGEGLMHAIGEDIAAFAAQDGISAEAKGCLLEVALDLLQSSMVPAHE